MAQQFTQAGTGHHIPLDMVEAALVSARMRRRNGGRTCALAAMTAAPLLQPDCSHPNRLRLRDEAMRLAARPAMCSPMERGHVAALIARTRLYHGLDEVRKTWGSGLRALLAENRYVLNGGQP
jgi:hypothetical protein